MAEDPEYEWEPLREGPDFTLYRGKECKGQVPILALAISTEARSASLARLEHEYSLATELETAWAAQPLALTRHQGRSVLIMKDPGGEHLDRVIERQAGQALDLTRFLRTAVALAQALGRAHRAGLIHKDLK